MCSMSVLCPLCAQTSFTSIDALRNSLIKAANGPLACPICSELFLGLDKLTIHLFSHTNFMTHTIKTIDLPTNSVPKNSNETKIIPKSSKSSIQNQAVNGDIVKFKKTVEEGAIVEKKTKKTKTKTAERNETDTHLEAQQLKTSTSPLSPPSSSLSPSYLPVVNGPTEPVELSICDICEFTFRTEQLRDMHFRLVHQNSPQPILMPTTTATTTSPTAISPASDADFKCHLCAKTFKMKGSLRVHLKVVHMVGITSGNSSSKLGICDRIRYKEIKNQQNAKPSCTKLLPLVSLGNQQIAAGSSKAFQSPHTTFSNSSNIKDLAMGKFNCISTQPHQGHISVETPISIIMPEASTPRTLSNAKDPSLLISNVLPAHKPQSGEITNETIINKQLPDNPKIWECDVCSKSFTTKYFLKKHKRLHTGEMPYSCEICARTFTFQQSYHKHLLYHSDEKPHICAVCGRAFKELSTLHNHERIHSGEKPFKCEICGKCFRQRVSFLVHTRIHTGVMPYKCEQCEKNFRYKVSLRTHKCQSSAASQLEAMVNTKAQISSPNTTNDQLTENFIKAFLESTTSGNTENQNEAQNSPASLEIASITESTCLEPSKVDPKSVEALLSKTIDDIVVESCNKMGIGSMEKRVQNNSITSGICLLNPSPSSNSYIVQNFSDGSSSPLQKFQNMRLQSPNCDDVVQINSSEHRTVQLPQFLFNNTFNGAQ